MEGSSSRSLCVRRVTWRVVPLATPLATRRCPRCDTKTSFACSERFRVNGQGGRLDAWLIYRCTACDARWKLEVFARRPVDTVPAALLAGLSANDRALAWRLAFDADLLRRAGARPELDVPWRVEQVPTGDGPLVGGSAGAEVTIELRYASIGLRLDRLIAGQLAISRSAVARLCRTGELHVVDDNGPRSLRRTVRSGQRLVIRAPG